MKMINLLRMVKIITEDRGSVNTYHIEIKMNYHAAELRGIKYVIPACPESFLLYCIVV
jgi:hypothetical protein